MNEARTAAGRELRTRLRLMFGAWQKLARSVPIHVPEIEDPKGWIAAIEQEAAATERQNTVERIREALLGDSSPVDALYERHTRAILDAALTPEGGSDGPAVTCRVCEGWGAYCDEHKPKVSR